MRRTEPLIDDLRSAITGDVEADTTARLTHGMDASNYRHVPRAVVFPRSTADVLAAVDVCRHHRVPITARGAGTSIGGQSLGDGVVLEFRRYLGGVVGLDPEQRTATVQPGLVLDRLRDAASVHGLTFGPDPSTHSRCTVGGMIGNNSCGSHSVAWGTTADNLLAVQVVTTQGAEVIVSRAGISAETASSAVVADVISGRLRDLVAQNLATLRTGLPALPRRISGYALDSLLPERGFDVLGALAGSEGTCALTTAATVRLVPLPAAKVLLLAGFADDIAAADAVPQVLDFRPLTVEGLARDLIDALTARGQRPAALEQLPPGGGWLFVEIGAPTIADAAAHANDLAQTLTRSVGASAGIVADPVEQRALWAIREAAAGIVTRLPDGSEAWPGWEDAAVPPQRLGGYLREFRQLLRRHDLHGVPYGHFGEGCVHVRIDFDLLTQRGRARFREFLYEAADLVAAHGGSLSGEHGDGQARSELLARMYSPEILGLFERFKQIWDPDGLLNPGVIARPRTVDTDLRFGGPSSRPAPMAGRVDLPVALRYPADGGSLAKAARRCVGVGKCLDTTSGVMCPSYMATGREEHSTRGRARLLLEVMRGEAITTGWRSPELRDALDLCLACKGCLGECPVNVDMASYKAEFLSHYYARRLRPAAHYSLGFLPVWVRAASRMPGLTNAALAAPWTAAVAKAIGGLARERELPRFAPVDLVRSATGRLRDRGRPQVLLWPDTFTNFFRPDIGVAAIRVLDHAGFDVRLPAKAVCCGLTWMSTGQLGIARRVLRRSVRTLAPVLRAGTPMVVLEPSCLAMLRHDAAQLLPAAELNRIGEQAMSLAEFLDTRAPQTDLGHLPAAALSQVHCHQQAVIGYEADRRVLGRAGVRTTVMDSGCCGLAGDFGAERGHFAVSVAVGERVMAPEIRAAGSDTLILADGFSCRTQIGALTDRSAVHLAEVLAAAIGRRSTPPQTPPPTVGAA